MPLLEDIAGDRTFNIDGVDLSRVEQPAALLHVPVARPLHVDSRAHFVPNGAIRGNVIQTHPKIQVTAIAADKKASIDGAGHFGVGRERLRIERDQVAALRQRPVSCPPEISA